MSGEKESSKGLKFRLISNDRIEEDKPVESKKRSGSVVLKANEVQQKSIGSIEIKKFAPTEMIGVRVPRPGYLPPAYSSLSQSSASKPASALAIESMKINLKNLNDLHGRLRFILKELEDLVQE